MTAIIVGSYIINVVVLVYAASIPSARWLAADRNKYFWIVLIGMIGLTSVGGLFVDIAFFVGVVPRMGSGAQHAPSGETSRTASTPNPFLKK